MSLRKHASNMFEELIPPVPKTKEDFNKSLNSFKREIWNYVHIPYIPALHNPGWLLRYIVGPYNKEYFEW